jgi:hypothetical protein
MGNPAISKQTSTTLPFVFPAHGNNFQYTTVYMNSGNDYRRLCRYPPCSICSKSPKASISHVDCFCLAKRNCSAPTLQFLLYIGLNPCYPPRPLPAVSNLAAYIDLTMTYITNNIKELVDIVNSLERLLSELRILLASYCPESPLWRYSVVFARYLQILEASQHA